MLLYLNVGVFQNLNTYCTVHAVFALLQLLKQLLSTTDINVLAAAEEPVNYWQWQLMCKLYDTT